MSSRHIKRTIASQAMPNGRFVELMSSVLLSGTPFRFQASGSSMSPFIKNGDVITVIPATEKGVRCGDVVAFTHPSSGRLAVHRVVRCTKDRCLIKGDNSNQPDGWIGQEQIMGHVTHIDRLDQPVRFGLGFERQFIALLSRHNLLMPGHSCFLAGSTPLF